jgi:phosphoribosyl 1,2-cyclic phosphodiesterase
VRFASLGSGSKGNATLVEIKNTCVLIDCGFNLKEMEQRLARINKPAQTISAILVTHEHGDHMAGVLPLARKYKIPVYATPGTHRVGNWSAHVDCRYVDLHNNFVIDDLYVQAVAVPHDAKEPSQFIVSDGDKRLGVLTDAGSITPHMRKHYYDCDALFIECNHDAHLLNAGPYPYSLKQRVGGDYGHLSNEQAATFLKSVVTNKIQHIVIGHLSEKNNTPARALQAVTEQLACESDEITIADQLNGFAWRTIN